MSLALENKIFANRARSHARPATSTELQSSTAASGLFGDGRTLLECCDTFWNKLPIRLGPNVNVLTNLDSRIAVDTAKRDAMYCSFINPAQGGAAFVAELQTKPVLSSKGRQPVFASQPAKFIRIN